LVPSWAKDISIGSKLINARAEGVVEKPSFRAAFKRRRCIVPADGFFEWKAGEGKSKIPHYIFLKDHPVFAFAGLWEVWRSPEGDELRTCTIITTDANSMMQQLHNRMPVILRPEDYALWLSDEEMPPDRLTALLKPYDSDGMDAYEVSTMVNRPVNDVPEVVRPVA
jgi:putative SOS response-associated peptidase YedK